MILLLPYYINVVWMAEEGWICGECCIIGDECWEESGEVWSWDGDPDIP